MELDDNSTWTLTGDSYITSLTCNAGSINLNGHILYVNGEVYTEGTDSKGEAIDITSGSGSSEDGIPTDGNGSGSGDTPSGMPGDGNGDTPPEKPDGNNGGTPPEKPDR